MYSQHASKISLAGKWKHLPPRIQMAGYDTRRCQILHQRNVPTFSVLRSPSARLKMETGIWVCQHYLERVALSEEASLHYQRLSTRKCSQRQVFSERMFSTTSLSGNLQSLSLRCLVIINRAIISTFTFPHTFNKHKDEKQIQAGFHLNFNIEHE